MRVIIVGCGGVEHGSLPSSTSAANGHGHRHQPARVRAPADELRRRDGPRQRDRRGDDRTAGAEQADISWRSPKATTAMR